MRYAWLKLTCGILLSAFWLSPTLAQETQAEAPPANTKSPTMTVFGDLIEIGSNIQITPEGDKPLEFNKQPLVSWSNPTRPAAPHGCIFVWSQAGRPQAIGSVFTFIIRNETRMKHQLHSISQTPLEATYEGQMVWKPSKPGITWMAPQQKISPHVNERLRLAQMRGIARQFNARFEKPDGEKTNLELKPTPLYRYQSPANKVVDGAIFSYANGTDPDVLLLIEAYEDDAGQKQWRLAFARFHYWRLVVEQAQGEVVWQVEEEPGLKLMTIGDTRHRELPYVSYIVDRQPLENDQ